MKIRSVFSPLFLFVLVVMSSTTTAQIINTIAGTGISGFTGDGGLATAARMTQPWGLEYDPATGNIYFSDFQNNRVRKIDPSGVVTTIAGNGTGAYSGDGGLATAAGIGGPTALAIYGTDLYIGEVFSSRVRKVNAAGIISTVAGNGLSGFSGDGGPATSASISNPNGIGVDGFGNIYICDQYTERIRKVTPAGIITTIAGSGSVGYSGDGGPATLAAMNTPDNVCADAAGNIYFSDFYNNVVRKISTTGIISTFAGNGIAGFSGDGGPATAAKLHGAACVRFDLAGALYIGDATNNRIRKVAPDGTISTIAGTGTAGFSGDGGPALAAQLNNINLAIPAPSGNIYVGDMFNNRLREIVYANIAPVFTAGVSQTLSVCENAAATPVNTLLTITDPDVGQTETWSLWIPPVHGTAVVSYSATSTGAAITPAGLTYTPATGYSGADSFKVRASDGLAADTIVIYVNVTGIPVVPVITGPAAVCAGGTITLNSTGTGGSWVSSDVSVAMVNSSGLVGGIAPGLSVISYTVTNSCGSATDTQTVSVAPFPAIAAITGPLHVCVGLSISLSDLTAGGLWSSSNTALATIGSSGIVSGVAAGTVIISYSVTATCGSVADTQVIVVEPSPVTTITGINTLCRGLATTLAGAPPGGTWSCTPLSVASINGGTGVINAVSAGSATVQYVSQPDEFGCIGTAIMSFTVISGLAINDNITAISCNAGTGSITLTAAGGVGPYQYLWQDGTTSAGITNLVAGTYSVTVSDPVSGCIGAASYTLTAPSGLSILADIKNDRCNIGRGAVDVSVSGGSSPYAYSWSNGAATEDISGLIAGNYSVTVSDQNHCIKEFAFEVAADTCSDLVIHNVITPNGDGINDVWVIEGLGSYPDNSVQLFDKWGDIIFAATNYDNSWSGKGKNGDLIPDGTYFYLVKLKAKEVISGKEVFTGSLLVKR